MMRLERACDAMLMHHITQRIGTLFRFNAIYFLPALA